MEFLVMRRSIFLMVLEYDDAQTTPLKHFCKEKVGFKYTCHGKN